MIKIGSRVRSFDFAGRELHGKSACYVEGVVEGIGRFTYFAEPRYKIRVERQIWTGLPAFEKVGGFVYPPVNGLRAVEGTTNCVELILPH